MVLVLGRVSVALLCPVRTPAPPWHGLLVFERHVAPDATSSSAWSDSMSCPGFSCSIWSKYLSCSLLSKMSIRAVWCPLRSSSARGTRACRSSGEKTLFCLAYKRLGVYGLFDVASHPASRIHSGRPSSRWMSRRRWEWFWFWGYLSVRAQWRNRPFRGVGYRG
jgi:hypothetical protein